MELSREHRVEESSGLLYPMMVIAAIALIAFSVLGIASIAGWMPSGLMSGSAAVNVKPGHPTDSARSGTAFECAECVVIESIREFGQNGALGGKRPELLAARVP